MQSSLRMVPPNDQISFLIISVVNAFTCHSQFLATVSRAAQNLLMCVPWSLCVSVAQGGGMCTPE